MSLDLCRTANRHTYRQTYIHTCKGTSTCTDATTKTHKLTPTYTQQYAQILVHAHNLQVCMHTYIHTYKSATKPEMPMTTCKHTVIKPFELNVGIAAPTLRLNSWWDIPTSGFT